MNFEGLAQLVVQLMSHPSERLFGEFHGFLRGRRIRKLNLKFPRIFIGFVS
jgi:hypothetical protein